MRSWRRCFFVCLLCACAAGCAQPPKGYLGRRGADLTDCFKFTVGYGLITYTRVMVTDWAVLGMGMAAGQSYGWRGRYGDRGWQKQRGGDVYIGDIHYQAGLPLVANEEGSDGAGNRVHTLGPSNTKHRYAKDLEPTRGGKVGDRFWIGIAATAGLSIEIGLNVAELVDLLLGITTLDILGDDEWCPRPVRGPEAAQRGPDRGSSPAE